MHVVDMVGLTLGHMYFFTGDECVFEFNVFISVDSFKRGVVTLMVGYCKEIVAVSAVVGGNNRRRLTAVSTEGVHMKVASKRISANEVFADRVNGKLKIFSQIIFEYTYIVLLLTLENVLYADTTVGVRLYFEFLCGK